MTLGVRACEAGEDLEDGGEGVEVVAFEGDGVGGNGLLLWRGGLGFGGTVLMNDLKLRTGFSMPSSDEDDKLAWVNGDRIWPRRLRFMAIARSNSTKGYISQL